MTHKQQDPGKNGRSGTARGIALGAGVGIILGAGLGNPGFGLVLGAALGLVAGPSVVRMLK